MSICQSITGYQYAILTLSIVTLGALKAVSELKPLTWEFEYEGEKWKLLIYREWFKFQRLKASKVFSGSLGLLDLQLNSKAYQDDSAHTNAYQFAIDKILFQNPNPRSLKCRQKGVKKLIDLAQAYCTNMSIITLKIIAGLK
jgi:hypothetical protein